jgi:hypothetical protein
MPSEKTECTSSFLKNPLVLSALILTGGLAAGQLIFPPEKDKETCSNEYMRKSVKTTGVVIAGIILYRQMNKEKL